MLRTTARQTTMRKLEFGWFLPTRGDTDDYGEPLKVPASFDMFRRVTAAAEAAGFEYMLVPVGHQCWDAWMTSALMIGATKSMRMLVAARPSYINPVLLAKMIDRKSTRLNSSHSQISYAVF